MAIYLNTRNLDYSISRTVADVLQYSVGIGTTSADGNCFFDTVRILFSKYHPLWEALESDDNKEGSGGGPLSIAMMRSWVADLFTESSYETYREVLDLWKSQYEDAFLSRNYGDRHYYDFISSVIDYLPPTAGMKTRLHDAEVSRDKIKEAMADDFDEIKEEEHEYIVVVNTVSEQIPEEPPATQQVNNKQRAYKHQLEKLERKIDVYRAYLDQEESTCDIPKAMEMMRQVVQQSNFWGEEVSIKAIVHRLANLLDVPVGFFIISLRYDNSNINVTPIISCDSTDAEDFEDGVFVYIYYNGGHYQPFRVNTELVHTFNNLSYAIFDHWKLSNPPIADLRSDDGGEETDNDDDVLSAAMDVDNDDDDDVDDDDDNDVEIIVSESPAD